METKHLNDFPKDHTVQIRTDLPEDYHCTCEFCQPENFRAEMFNNDSGKYYSNKVRKRYYDPEAGKHLDVGQVIGYRWAIQNLTEPGDWILDPTVGSGTAIVEAVNNGRHGAGIELEYPETCLNNIKYQKSNMDHVLISGNALDIDKHLDVEDQFQLIVNGPPYPSGGSLSSDAPQRSFGMSYREKGSKTFNYDHQDSIGLKRGTEYETLIRTYFGKAIPYLKKGGYLVLLIKDMVRNRKAFLLHHQITQWILEDNLEMEYDSFFIHKHTPTTMFINTYNKRFPDVKIPLYQTGIILKKTI